MTIFVQHCKVAHHWHESAPGDIQPINILPCVHWMSKTVHGTKPLVCNVSTVCLNYNCDYENSNLYSYTSCITSKQKKNFGDSFYLLECGRKISLISRGRMILSLFRYLKIPVVRIMKLHFRTFSFLRFDFFLLS